MLLALLVAAGGVKFVLKRRSELAVYVLAAERMVRGEAVYRPEPSPFTYPPFFALPFVPLAPLAAPAQRVAWYLINLAALVAIVSVLRRLLAPMLGASPRRFVFWLLVLLLAVWHLAPVFENQSHDLLVLLPLGLALAARGGAAAGLWTGLASACKATPLLFAPVFLWQRRFAAALLLLVCAALFTGLPDLFFPRAEGGSWAVSWWRTFGGEGARVGEAAAAPAAWAGWNRLNQSLSGTVHRLGTSVDSPLDASVAHLDRTVLRLVVVAAQLAVLALVACATRRVARPRPERRLGEGGAVVCGMVLLSPMSSKSHFCVLLLPLAYCVADQLYRKRDPVVCALLGVVFVSGLLTAKSLWGFAPGDRLLACGVVTWGALATLVATLRVLMLRDRAAPAEP
ncbi:MAG: glycosyltransferase family 87 protein [Planctomycetota bacterium]